MMTKHFNLLTEAEAERLAILAEEAGEIVQACCKILRHGYESGDPRSPGGPTNRQQLQEEMGDMLLSIDCFVKQGDVDEARLMARVEYKRGTASKHLHHQPEY